MDKTNPQLDPKLKEAYDRVMGTVVNPVKQPEPQAPVAPHIQDVPPVIQAPQTIAAQPPQAANNVPSPTVGKVKAKKKGISPLIISLGILVFLVVYAIVWVKFFGLTVPYLNP